MMKHLRLPLNLHTQEGQDKATLTKCKCVKDKSIRVTRKNTQEKHKKARLTEFIRQEPNNETRK